MWKKLEPGAKVTCGASSRVHVTAAKKMEIIEMIRQNKILKKKNVYQEVSKATHVAFGNLSRWWAQRKKIEQAASIQTAAQVLGVKTKRLMKDKARFDWAHDDNLRSLTNFVKDKIKERLAARRSVNLPWLHKVVIQRCKCLKDMGIDIKYRGVPFTGSRSFCYRWLIRNGFVSRVRTKIRSTTPGVCSSVRNRYNNSVRTNETSRTQATRPRHHHIKNSFWF